jgi:nucleoside diphosphate kinase homolog 5
VIALALERDNAVAHWRKVMGPTNSIKAAEEAPDSIRARFGTDGTANATHGSDSMLSAAREILYWFPDGCVCSTKRGCAAPQSSLSAVWMNRGRTHVGVWC